MCESRPNCRPIRVPPARLAFVAVLALLCSTGAFGVYYQPTHRLVLNEVLEAGPDAVVRLPLYLSKRGSYYAELFLEPSSDRGEGAAHSPAQSDLAFTVTIVRRDRVLVSEAFQLTLESGEPAETLFWMESPWDVPDRKDLTVILKFDAADTRLHPAYRLRLQIQRKPNLPLFRR